VGPPADPRRTEAPRMIDGNWTGHFIDYRLLTENGARGRTFGISATLRQNGNHIEGTMTDLETEWDTDFSQVLKDWGDKFWVRDFHRWQKLLDAKPDIVLRTNT